MASKERRVMGWGPWWWQRGWLVAISKLKIPERTGIFTRRKGNNIIKGK
jgi:hypothetical protein